MFRDWWTNPKDDRHNENNTTRIGKERRADNVEHRDLAARIKGKGMFEYPLLDSN